MGRDDGGDFTITPARETTHEPLDTVIRAFREGDGATIARHHVEILIWLRELRDRREQERGMDHEPASAETSSHGR